ncbi:hypothetical protein KAI04_00885 [Candidatus Pacearchaeota archaeon]|nr:hypothetical protein [Candidatus Pacearchaeota archaeon]
MKEENLKLLLLKQGFENLNRLDGSLYVYSAFFNKEKRILKASSYESSDLVLYNKELKGLKRLNGLKNITSLITEIKFDFPEKNSLLSDDQKILPFVLVKDYAKGNIFSGQYLSTNHQQQAINLINEIHNEGFIDLDIKSNNFIYFSKEDLVFIDIFNEDSLDTFEFKNNKEIQRLKKADLDSLEIMLSN